MDTYEFWDELGNIFDAVSAYQRKSVEFNRHFINPWIRLGPLFDRNNRDQDTIMAYQKAVELDATNADIWLELGDAYFKVGEYENAADAYQKAIELDEGSGWSYSKLAHAYLYQGKYSEAVDLYLKSIANFDNDRDKAISWNRLGNLYRKLHEYEKALQAFQQADSLDSNASGMKDNLRQCGIDSSSSTSSAVTAGQSDEELGLGAPQNEPEPLLNHPEIKKMLTGEPTLTDLANKTTSVWDANSAGSEARNPSTVVGETTDAFPEDERAQVAADYEEILKSRDSASSQRLSQISNYPRPNDELSDSNIATVLIDCAATIETPEETFEKQVERKIDELGNDNAIDKKASDVQEKPLSFDDGQTWLESDPEKMPEEELPLSINSTDSPLAFQDALPGINVETERCKDANKIEESSKKTALPSFFDDLDGSLFLVTPFTAGVMNQPTGKEHEDIIGPSVWDESDSTDKNESSLTHEETGDQGDLVCSTNFEENDNCLSDHTTGKDTIVELMDEEPVQSDGLIPTNTEVDTDNAYLWNELGNVNFNNGAFHDAAIAYGKAIELDPWFAWPYSNLGLVYFREGKLDDAIYMYQQGIGLFTDEKGKAVTWNRLGDAYRRLNDYDNAIVAYQKADELNPITTSFSFKSSLLGGQNKYQKSAECPTTGGYYESA
jgi:tetratricopeptide (TPR) repeat protein